MTVVHVTRQMSVEEAQTLLNTKPNTTDPLLITDYPTTVISHETQKPIALLTKALDDDCRLLTAAALKHHKLYGGGVVRAGGMRSRSATFGFSGAAPQMSRPTPSASAWAYQDATGHAVIANYATELNRVLFQDGPKEISDKHLVTKNSIHADWRLGDTCWTSGIVNDTANLYYHYDKNNVEGTWSAMIVLRAGVRGGYLHLPEYDLTLPCGNGDIVYFPGMSLVHGVTPIVKSLPSGRRFSIVYYSMKNFVNKPSSLTSVQTSRARQSVLSESLLDRQRAAGLLRDQPK